MDQHGRSRSSCIVVIWKLVIAVFDVSPFVLPQPEDVIGGIGDLVSSDGFWSDVRMTLTETLVGFGIALVLGIGLGTLLGRVVWLEQALRPVIVASQVVPKVALIPLFIIWFGFGITSKIIIVALLAFFPILLNVILGVRSVDTGQRDVMRSLNASRAGRRSAGSSTRARCPTSWPAWRWGSCSPSSGAVVGEYLGGDQGLGYRIVTSLNNLEAETLFAVILVPDAVRLPAVPRRRRAQALPHPVARLGDRQHEGEHVRRLGGRTR